MKLYIDLEHESTDDTMAYVHANRSFGPTPRVPLTDCYIYQRGKYILIEYEYQVHYWEHIGHGCYLEEALYYLEPDKPSSWKTLDRLVIFRQALRENAAQGMGLDDLLHPNMNRKAFETFIGIARVYDQRHHGHPTF